MNVSYLRLDDHVAIQTSFWESKDGNYTKARIDEARRIRTGSLDDWEEITNDLWEEMEVVGAVYNFGLIKQEPITGMGMVYHNATPEYFADELNCKPVTNPSFKPITSQPPEFPFTLDADLFIIAKRLIVNGRIEPGFESANGYIKEVQFDNDINTGYVYNVGAMDLNRGIKTAIRFTIDPTTRNVHAVDCEPAWWMNHINNSGDFSRNPLNMEIHHLLYQNTDFKPYQGVNIWVTSRRFHYLRSEDGKWQLFHNPESLERAIVTVAQKSEWEMYQRITDMG